MGENSYSRIIQFIYEGKQHEAEVEIILYHEWDDELKCYRSYIEDLVIESIYQIEDCEVIEFEKAPQTLIELIKEKAEESLEDKEQ